MNAQELLSAIRRHCLACCGGERKTVRACTIRECDLYPYRCAPESKERPCDGQITMKDLEKAGA